MVSMYDQKMNILDQTGINWFNQRAINNYV